MTTTKSYYEVLGVSQGATNSEIRAAFREVVLVKHPDQGGDEEEFQGIQSAYEVLSDPRKRRIYDRFGEAGLQQNAETLFAQTFRGGSFAPEAAPADDLRQEVNTLRKQNESLQRQLTLVNPEENKFASSFESWLRNREPGQVRTLTTEDLIREGVTEESYDPTPLPKLKGFALRYSGTGRISDVVEKHSASLPKDLKWGECLIQMLAAPLSFIDRHAAKWGMIPGEDTPPEPFVAGAQGVGIVIATGEGVKQIRPNDLVIPNEPLCGTWRPLAVIGESRLYPFPPTDVAPELLANFFAFVTAYRLLEDFGHLLPGDTVIQSSPESAVGQAVIQLCTLLQVKTINLLDDSEKFDEVSDMLHGLGGTHVWKNDGSISTRVGRRGAARPRLAIDGIGGPTLKRMVDCLRDGSTLVSYAARGRGTTDIPHAALIHQGIELQGFWVYRWLREREDNFAEMADLLLPLLEGGKLTMECSLWEKLDKSYDAMLHDPMPNVVLKLGDQDEASKLVLKVDKKSKKKK